MRSDGRRPDQLRPVTFERGFTSAAAGSVLVRAGRTHVLCTACIDESVPEWRAASGQGWVTAEYDMLPGSTGRRRNRDRAGKLDGRTQEIQRLIGRSLRTAVNMSLMGPRSILLDCDVLQADGGTRTAAVTGAYVALHDAIDAGRRRGLWGEDVLRCAVAAVSVAVVSGKYLLDPDYAEDSAASIDCNLVMTERGEWIEIQATGERTTFGDETLQRITRLGRGGIEQLLRMQREVLLRPAPDERSEVANHDA